MAKKQKAGTGNGKQRTGTTTAPAPRTLEDVKAGMVDSPPGPKTRPMGYPAVAGTPIGQEKPEAIVIERPNEPGLARVKLTDIVAEPHGDHRDGEDPDLDRLAASLVRDGLLQSVVLHVVGSKYEPVDGRRRIAAARKAGWEDIEATVYPANVDAQTVRRLAAVANLERRDLNPVEEALAVVRLLEARTGRTADVWTAIEAGVLAWAAAALGRPEKWVRDRAYLTRLCPKVRAMVADGRLPLAQAREVCKLASAEDQTTVAGFTISFDSTPGAQIYISSVAKVRRAVAERLATLRGVPWDKAVAFAGRPACDGCPDNSEHSTLFGIDAKDAAPEARCLSAVCHRAKMKAAEAALEAAVKGLKGQKSVAPTAASVRGPGVPDYLNAATVARKLAKARGIEPKKPKAAGGKQRPPEIPWEERPETRFSNARHDWSRKIEAAVMTACVADPMRLARLLMLTSTKTYRRNQGCQSTPSKAVRAKIEPLLAKIVKGDAGKALAEMAADIDPARTSCGLRPWEQWHLAGLMGLDLPPEPVLADFEENKGTEGRRDGGTKDKGKKATAAAKPECDHDCETCTAKDCPDRACGPDGEDIDDGMPE